MAPPPSPAYRVIPSLGEGSHVHKERWIGPLTLGSCSSAAILSTSKPGFCNWIERNPICPPIEDPFSYWAELTSSGVMALVTGG